MLKKWSCVSALMLCTLVQSLDARNIYVTSTDVANTGISTYATEPLSFAGTISGLAGSNQVLAGTGGKLYVTGRTAADGLAVLQGTFPSFQVLKRMPLPAVPTAAAISPDGRRVVVVYPGGVQVLDTATDNFFVTATPVNVGANPPSVAISSDSRRAFVAAQELQRIVAINLDNGTSAGDVPVIGQPTSVNIGPNTLLYVTVQNAIYEIDPQSLQLRGTFSLSGFPGPISFTPDGRFGLAPNTSIAVTGKSAFLVDLLSRTVTDVPPIGVLFSKIVVADNASAYALSTQTNRVYRINLLSSGAAPALLAVPGVSLDGAVDIQVSDEGPQAKSLFVLTNSSLYRVDIASNVAIGPIAAPSSGKLSFAPPPTTGAPSTLLQLNNPQTLLPGGSLLPIRVRAVNSGGVPVANVPITFTTEAVGVTLTNASSTTDQFGFAQATVTIPSSITAGVVTINAAAGGLATAFTINVASTNPGPGEPSQGGLLIVAGQGQITSVNLPTPKPLTVQVVDASGKPIPNVPLAWAISQGTGGLGNVSTVTDENGLGTALFSNFLVPFGVAYSTAVVSASTGSQTVNFIVTTVANLPNGTRGEATFVLRKPLERTITVRAGETLTGAIEVAVGSLAGTAIPNVGIRLETPTASGPTATCRGGVPLSDNAGIVTCDLVAGGTVGDTELRAFIGETAIYTFTLRVEAGLATTVRISGGNNQSGNAGALLPVPLQVEVLDAGGNLLPGIPVTWEVVAAGSATVAPASTTTDSQGRATTRVTLGQQPGLVQIRARAGTASSTFSFTVNAAAAQLTVSGGTPQSAAAGQAFAQPVSVRLLNAQSQPLVGASVQFAVTSGAATVPASAATDANGIASATVTAGATPGPVVVRATYGSLTQDINLTVLGPGAVFNASSFVNAAGYQPGISPGSIAVINATGIAPDLRGSLTPQSLAGPLPTSLGGVEVLFNNVPAPIYSVNNINGQQSVIVQVPFETAAGGASVTIRTTGGGSTTVAGIPIQAVKPGFFDFVDANNQRSVVALRPDGSYVTAANPARRGETVRVFATGLGQTTPAAGTNRAGARDQNVAATVIAGINNEGVRLVSAKMMEGSVGLYVVEMEVPATTTAGSARPIAIAVAGPDGALVYAGGVIAVQ